MENQTITSFGDLAVGLNGLVVTFIQSLEDEPTAQELNELDLETEVSR
jgi:hypothetical protein